jgi:S1-C subfamily serine protease
MRQCYQIPPRVLRAVGLRLWILLLLASTAAAQSSVAEVVESAASAVVRVTVFFEPGGSSPAGQRIPLDGVPIQRPGSGIILSKGGLVVTNAHLVAEIGGEETSEYWLVVFTQNGRPYTADVIARDERTDLALLQLHLTGNDALRALPLADLDDRRLGERVVALSAPGASKRFAFAGALALASGPMRLREAVLEPHEILLSDTRFHEHLDGGPLLDGYGAVLGIHNSSHISALPANFSETDPTVKVVSKDYAAIVSATAIRAAFGSLLEAEESPRVPVDEASFEVAPEAIQSIAPSVVSVWASPEEFPTHPDLGDPQGQRLGDTHGSGVIVDPAGLVLTSADLFHEENKTALVRLSTGEQFSAELVVAKREKRVALLRLALPEGMQLPAARIADSRLTIAGEFVAIVGRPFLGPPTMSVGVLSAVEREGLIQVASWVHKGHWGGALIDRTGRLLGIAIERPEGTSRGSDESYLGFAAPTSGIVEWFQDSWAAEFDPYTEEEVQARTTPVAGVTARTEGSLINVLVSQAVEQAPSGFDPFASNEKKFELQSQGSGVVIDEGGLALSNWHVVASAIHKDGSANEDFQIKVTMPNGRSYTARVLSTSRDDDLSLLALELGVDETLIPVELGDSDAIRIGEPVIAIGNPLGLSNSISAGIVSTKNHDTLIQSRLHEYKGMLMTDAAINPGNSGGALLDTAGRLVGINSAGSVGSGMAIPVNKALEVFSDKLLSASSLRSSYLGLKVEEHRGGLVVTHVDAHGPAARATLELGDRLVRLGGQEIASSVALARVRSDLRRGASVELVVSREDEEIALEITPLSYVAWNISRQCGIEVEELDYAAETQLVHDASLALYRSYTQNDEGEPTSLMTGALRVVRVLPLDADHALAIEPGDLLLGMTAYDVGAREMHERLLRFESLAHLASCFAPRATKDGEEVGCWYWRDGEVLSTPVFVRRAPR